MPRSSARFSSLSLAGVALFVALWIAQWPVLALAAGLPAHNWTALRAARVPRRAGLRRRDLGLFGKPWLASFWRGRRRQTVTPPSSASSGTRVNVRGLPSRSTPISTALADPLAGEQADQVVRAGDRLAVERDDHVAGEQARAVRRTARLGRRDGRGRACATGRPQAACGAEWPSAARISRCRRAAPGRAAPVRRARSSPCSPRPRSRCPARPG